MGYRVLGSAAEIYQGYGARAGLDGPFVFAGNRILYYDCEQGQYWDPRTDFYVEQSEMNDLHLALAQQLSR